MPRGIVPDEEKERELLERQRGEHKARKQRAYEAYRTVFGNPDFEAGAIILEELRAICFAERTTMVRSPVGGGDALLTAVNEGQRNVWNYIQVKVKIATTPHLLERAVNQALTEENEND